MTGCLENGDHIVRVLSLSQHLDQLGCVLHVLELAILNIFLLHRLLLGWCHGSNN